MDKKTQEAHRLWAVLLREVKAILELELGPLTLFDVLEYLTFINQNSELTLSLKHHAEKENAPMYG